MNIYGDAEASKYLKKRGVKHRPATLKKKRSVGGGPEFWAFNGRFAGYSEEHLDRYVSQRMEVVASTSQAGHGKRPDVNGAEDDDAKLKPVTENRPDRSGDGDTSGDDDDPDGVDAPEAARQQSEDVG
jgi:hypothetical protein